MPTLAFPGSGLCMNFWLNIHIVHTGTLRSHTETCISHIHTNTHRHSTHVAPPTSHTHTHTHTHTRLHSHHTHIRAICSNMDGPRNNHTKWNKSGRERQIFYNITYMWNLKKSNQFIHQKQTHWQKTNLWLPSGKEEGKRGRKDRLGVWEWH